jgi:C-terminal processing protease CtpA/Prc
MKTRLFTIAIAVLVTASALADKPIRRTVVIRDGKVISDGAQVIDLNDLGGKRAYLGVSMIDISSDLREHYGASRDAGILVGSVADDSPAEKAGLKVGDILTAIDGKDVKTSSDVRAALRDKKEGDTVRVEVLRGRGRQALVATLVEREGPRLLMPGNFEELTRQLGSNEWKARVERLGSSDCDELQGRIKELETRLRELEKKLNK